MANKGGPLPFGDLGRGVPNAPGMTDSVKVDQATVGDLVGKVADQVVDRLIDSNLAVEPFDPADPRVILAKPRSRKSAVERARLRIAQEQQRLERAQKALEKRQRALTAGPNSQDGGSASLPFENLSERVRKDLRNRTYTSWHNMLMRCYNPQHVSYAEYGGRGIQVFVGWIPKEFKYVKACSDDVKALMADSFAGAFAQFVKDVGYKPSAKHTLDRREANGHYIPRNVRWATAAEQNVNKRILAHEVRHPVTGVIITAAALAKQTGLSYQLLRARMMNAGTWYELYPEKQKLISTNVALLGASGTATDSGADTSVPQLSEEELLKIPRAADEEEPVDSDEEMFTDESSELESEAHAGIHRLDRDIPGAAS